MAENENNKQYMPENNKHKEKISQIYSDNIYLRTLISNIPWIGGLLDLAISEKWNKIREKRLEKLIEKLIEEFGQMQENMINTDILESEGFSDFILDCITSSVKSKQNSKIKNYAKIISKSFTDLNFDFDEFDILNPILNSLSENEILILIQLKEWEQKFKDDYINMLDYANERVQIN